MDMEISFSGGMRVDAHFDDFTVKTDQPEKAGGEGTAPAPFDLFLASLGTCIGVYVKFFCEARKIPMHGIRVIQTIQSKDLGKGRKKIEKIIHKIEVPPDFPEKYCDALARAASQCTVKKFIENPPPFEIKTVLRQAG